MQRQQQSDFINCDRKLRPIFDNLDNGCHKKALQEIDKLLKKNKDSQYLRVLKSLTLIRMGRKKDGAELLSEVFNEKPFEDAVLQTMSMCYREIQRNDLIVSIYENALKKDPTNEKLHTHLFMAYVRVQDYKKQQLTALNLYKVHPKSPYYFWGVMSIYMQAINSKDDKIANNIILPLAEKMCEKFKNENKFKSEAEYELYLMILEKQKKYPLMIELMNSLRNKRIIKDHFNFFLHREAKLLKLENRLVEAFYCLKQMITANNDQYEYYIEAYEVALLLDKEKQQQNLEEATNGIDATNENQSNSSSLFMVQLLEMVQEMCENEKTTIWKLNSNEENENDSLYKNVSKRCPRGPFMARIVINHLIKKENNFSLYNDDEKLQQLTKVSLDDLLLEYFMKFGSKYVCIKDIIFIQKNIQMTDEQINNLLMMIKLTCCDLKEKNDNRNLCLNTLEYYNRKQFCENIDNRITEAFKLFMPHYKEVVEKCLDSDVNEKDPLPFDGFVYFLVTSVLADLDIYQKDDQTINSIIYNMIVFLEHHLQENKSDFYAKLLLLCFYNAIGAGQASHFLYNSLEIKLIQNDTLGFYFLPFFLNCSLYNQAKSVIALALKFYSFNFKEVPDYIISGYKNGSFSKIEEIINFDKKLRNSLQYHSFFIEKFFNDFMTNFKSEANFNDFSESNVIPEILDGNFNVDWQKVCDNRDLQILKANHHQIDSYIANILKPKTFEQETLFVRLRFDLIKAIVIGNHLSRKLFPELLSTNPVDDGDDNNNHQPYLYQSSDHEQLSFRNFEQLVYNLNELIEKCEKQSQEKLNYCLTSPPPSRLNTFFFGKHPHLISILLNQLLNLFKFTMNQQTSKSSETNSNDEEEIQIECNDLKESKLFNEIQKEIDDNIYNYLEMNQTLKGYYFAFGRISTLMEVLSICVALYGLINNNLHRFTKSIKRGKKKNTKTFKTINKYLNNLSDNLLTIYTNLDKYLESLKEFITKMLKTRLPVVEKLQYTFPFENQHTEKLVKEIQEKLSSGYIESMTEMELMIRCRHKYLTSLSSN